MSRLTDLIRQTKETNLQLGDDLEREFQAIAGRLEFGLNFERHKPEAVELPQRAVRCGDKVRVLPERGSSKKGDQRLWRVGRINRAGQAHLCLIDQPDTQVVDVPNCVVVAEFRDPIYPGLASTGTVKRGGDKPFQTVINGENFHVLEALTYTHQGTIDCIYIDPPYNTGARDWKYNNDYVEGDDLYRHSKWLAFMERRLRVAARLLRAEKSVLICTIDEKEYQRLGLLLEQLFPEARIQMTTIVTNPNGVPRGAELARVEEYAYFCFFGAASPSRLDDTMLDQGPRKAKEGIRWEWLLRGGANARRIDRPNLFYPIYVDGVGHKIAEVGAAIPLDVDRSTIPDRAPLATLWPISSDGAEARWRTSPEYLRALLNAGMAKLGAYDAKSDRWAVLYLGKAQIRRIESGEITKIGNTDGGALELEQAAHAALMTPKTVWNRARHAAGEHGSRMLRAILPGRTFPFPKSLYAVEDCLRVAISDNPNAVVLDFFAGSGTTAHAVMRLNHRDGGNRQCISVTNNEVSADEQKGLLLRGLRPGDHEWEQLGICDYITNPRLEAAISGRTPSGIPIKGDYRFRDEFPMAEGFEENAEFFTLTYEAPIAVGHNKAFERIAPLLWLRAGSQGKRIDRVPKTGWAVADAYAILFDLDRVTPFCKAVICAKDLAIAYIVTDDDRRYQSVVKRLPKTVQPVRLYESYLSNFRISPSD